MRFPKLLITQDVVIVSLPTGGDLFQYDNGQPGNLISINDVLVDPLHRVVFIGSVAGDISFEAKFINGCQGCSQTLPCLVTVAANDPASLPVAVVDSPALIIEGNSLSTGCFSLNMFFYLYNRLC